MEHHQIWIRSLNEKGDLSLDDIVEVCELVLSYDDCCFNVKERKLWNNLKDSIGKLQESESQ